MSRMAEHAAAIESRDLEDAAWHEHEQQLMRRQAFAAPMDIHNANTLRNLTMNTNANTLDNLTFDQLVPGGGKYLKKSDVGEDGMVLTIKGFKLETVKGDEGDEEKVVLYFVEEVPPMILNKTNSSLLAVVTGAQRAGDAKGKQVVVYDDPTISFGGKITGGLRIKKVPGAPRTPAAAPRAAAARAAAPQREPGSDDDKGVDFNDPVPF